MNPNERMDRREAIRRTALKVAGEIFKFSGKTEVVVGGTAAVVGYGDLVYQSHQEDQFKKSSPEPTASEVDEQFGERTLIDTGAALGGGTVAIKGFLVNEMGKAMVAAAERPAMQQSSTIS